MPVCGVIVLLFSGGKFKYEEFFIAHYSLREPSSGRDCLSFRLSLFCFDLNKTNNLFRNLGFLLAT